MAIRSPSPFLNKAGTLRPEREQPASSGHFHVHRPQDRRREDLPRHRPPAVDFACSPNQRLLQGTQGNEVLKYNPSKAKELWAKANAISPWSGEFGIAYNADGTAKNWVEAICNYIKNTLDIDADIPMSTSDNSCLMLDSGKMTSAYRSGWGPDYPSADNCIWYSCTIPVRPTARTATAATSKSPEFDAMMDKALSAPSTEEADKYYQPVEEILLQDLPASSRCGTRIPPQPAPPRSPALNSITVAAQCSPH